MTKAQIDPKGIAPGLVPVPEAPKELSMRCRRAGCDSNRAVEVPMGTAPGSGRHLYRCLVCQHTWGLNLGGSVDF